MEEEIEKKAWQNRKIGVLWVKLDKQKQKFLSGNIKIDHKEINIIIFKNQHKKNKNQPDYEIFVSKSETAIDIE